MSFVNLGNETTPFICSSKRIFDILVVTDCEVETAIYADSYPYEVAGRFDIDRITHALRGSHMIYKDATNASFIIKRNFIDKIMNICYDSFEKYIIELEHEDNDVIPFTCSDIGRFVE